MFFTKTFKITTRQHGSNRIVPYLKSLNDARGRNKIKVGFNYYSLSKRPFKIVWKDSMGQIILSLLHRTLVFENRANAEFSRTLCFNYGKFGSQCSNGQYGSLGQFGMVHYYCPSRRLKILYVVVTQTLIYD